MQFILINSSSDPLFKQAMDIYVDSFPDYERHPVWLIAKRLDSSDYLLYAGVADGEVTFICLLWEFKGSDYYLLDYLAVKSDWRSKSLGGKFMLYLKERLTNEGKLLLLEVEHPEYGDDKDLRKRRIGFYERYGAKTIEWQTYWLPMLGNGTEPTAMLLMQMPAEPMPSPELMKELIRRIYKELHGRGEDDPLLASFLN